MTTLKDLLNDFAYDVAKSIRQAEVNGTEEDWKDVKDELVEEYTERICKRWVGQE